jgi:hypothetical protein
MAIYRPSLQPAVAPSAQPGWGGLVQNVGDTVGGWLQKAGGNMARVREEQPGVLTEFARQFASPYQANRMKDTATALQGDNSMQKHRSKLKILRDMGIDPTSPQGQQFLLSGTGGGGTTYGKTPVWGTDANGNAGLGVIGDDGSFKILDTGGFKPKRVLEWRDTKTHHEGVDPFTGEVVESIPIDNREAAAEQKIGDIEGAIAGTAWENVSAADDALYTLAQIRNTPDLESFTGWSSWGNIRPGSPGYDFQRLVEQASSGAFLTAIQKMVGLGALSNAEGATATAAVTRMRTELSKDGFLRAVADYERLVRKGKVKAQRFAEKYGVETPGAGENDWAEEEKTINTPEGRRTFRRTGPGPEDWEPVSGQ